MGVYLDTSPTDFRLAIGTTNLIEMEYVGGSFTWMNEARNARRCQSKMIEISLIKNGKTHG